MFGIRHRRSGTSSFTLVELLVVLAILLMLMSIALPGLISAQEAGLRTVCAARLREMFPVFEKYADEHSDQYPALWGGWPGNYTTQWPYYISETITGVRVHTDYTKRMNPERVPYAFCPKLMRMGVWWWYAVPKEQAYTSYGLSGLRLNASGTTSLMLAARRSLIPNPAGTVLLGDGDAPVKEYPGYPWMNAWLYHSNIRIHPHQQRSNYVYCDGHISSLTEEQVQSNPKLFIAY
jgi:prepilin-type processing-associated H-X9-DG protein/prepilin-type N-terminal cleavage/methylation domain-containing protein